MAIPKEEWLHLAKRHPIGGQGRHRHNREGRLNLEVGNKADRYWCYCHSCHEGGVVMKEHVRELRVEPKASRDLTPPWDMVPYSQVAPEMQDRLNKYLLSKNMHPAMFPPGTLYYSDNRKRLLFIWSEESRNMMGRDITDLSPQKWLTYTSHNHLAPHRYEHSSCVVVEDAFSFIKVMRALSGEPIDVFCSMGTSIRDSMFLKLLQNYSHVWMFYDGDKAGFDGAQVEAKRLRASGLRATVLIAPQYKDPKDMDIRDIQSYYMGVRKAWTI